MQKVRLDKNFLSELAKLENRPYSRGNRRAGMREQVFNCYDADAENIKITFKNFGWNYKVKTDSSIIFEDDGIGIPAEMLQNWFIYRATTKRNPNRNKYKTDKGRVLKGGGEAGLGGEGRSGTYLLGFRGKISTQPKIDKSRYILNYDFTTSQATLEIAPASTKHGTTMEFYDLHGKWSKLKVLGLCDKFIRLYRRVSLAEGAPCNLSVYKDDKPVFSITYKLRGKKTIWAIIIYRLAILNFKRLIPLL